MNRKNTSIVFPVLLMVFGVAWLLTVKNVDPRISWIPVLGMAAVGILALVVGGIDKVTIVVGPFLLIATVFSILRQTGYIDFETSIPTLVIIAGLLMLVSHLSPVPYPPWLQTPPPSDPMPRKLTLQDKPPQSPQR